MAGNRQAFTFILEYREWYKNQLHYHGKYITDSYYSNLYPRAESPSNGKEEHVFLACSNFLCTKQANFISLHGLANLYSGK